jgi:O-acetyl-ADP-ribose deacetylase (regulator of RNase III)
MIRYITGDATQPTGEGTKIITHVCNDIGAWGAGFVLALSNRWDEPEREYRKLKHAERQLGNVQLVCVEPDKYVANMIAQRGIMDTMKRGVLDHGREPAIRYDALKKCLEQVRNDAHTLNASVHMPRIGCGLAGGKWEKIEPIIMECLVDAGIEVVVYDFPNTRDHQKIC